MTRPDLFDAINAFNANDLGAMLVAAGHPNPPKNKEGKVKLWVEEIGQPARINRALEQVDERAHRALELLQRYGGEMRTARFRSLLVQHGIAEKDDSRGRTSMWSNLSRPELAPHPRTFSEVLAHLLLHGLVWTYGQPAAYNTATRLNFEGGRYVYIPDEVARHLPAPPELQPPPLKIEQVLAGSARTCQRDLYLTWSAARETRLTLTNTSLLRVIDLKRIASQLLVSETVAAGTKESDYRRIFFLRRLLTAQDLLEENQDSGTLTAHPQPTFFSQPAVARVRDSFQSWRDGAWWNELWATYVQGTTRASGNVADFAPQPVAQARHRVLTALAHLAGQGGKANGDSGDEAWVTLDALDEYLRSRDESFLIDRQMAEEQAHYYYYGSDPYTSPYSVNPLGWIWSNFTRDEEAGWRGVERVFIQAVIAEGLYWLGLVDLGYERPVAAEAGKQSGGKAPDGWKAVRLTDMGRWLLMGGPPPTIPEESGRVVLQPNFHVFAFDPISDSVLARLDSFATRLNAERAVEFEITRESVYRSQLAGQSVPAIKDWLEQVTGNGLPQNVSRSLDEWQASFDRIVVWERVAWLEVAQSWQVASLMADPLLQRYVIKQITPTGLLIYADKADALEQALLKKGELPARVPDPQFARHASIHVDEAGRITLLQQAPWLYVRARLEALAELTTEGWRITPGSLARAAAAGYDAAAVLADLTHMAAGGVPESLVVDIKRWARHYGEASFQPVVLVQFRDQETLDDLRQDRALRNLLKPIRANLKLGLAKIDPADLHRVKTLLRERGVEIKDVQGEA